MQSNTASFFTDQLTYSDIRFEGWLKINELRRTRDREEVREWIDDYDGKPAHIEGSLTELTIDFGDKEDVEDLSWKEFFDIFEKENLVMIHEIENIIGSDGRHPSEQYDFELYTRDSLGEVPETEMDDQQVRSNTEETSI